MSTRSIAILTALVVIVVGLVCVLFAVQNSARTTQLSLDLWFAAWQLAQPVSVPALMGVCFGSGLLIGGGWFAVRASAASRRVRVLERQLALADQSSGSGWS